MLLSIHHLSLTSMTPSFLRLPLRALALAAVVFTLAAVPGQTAAQSFSLGGDLVSRYIWRGADFGESFSIQPTLEFSSGALTIGSWASYSIAADGAGANEHDLYLSITAGPVSFGVTDYYFPAPGGTEFFNYDGDGNGAHWIEPFISFDGTEDVPLTLFAGAFLHNDPDNSVYLEAGYPFQVGETELGLALGVVPMESAFYGTTGAAVVNLSLSAAHAVSITDRFALPVSVTYILNPYAERSFLVFGISL